VPFEVVDAVVEETFTVQQRVRVLPSRVAVYLLLAAAPFAECCYRQVWAGWSPTEGAAGRRG